MVDFVPRYSGARNAAKVLFAIWGLAGLGFAIFAMLGAPILTAIYVTLMWIGGVVFFGFCVVMSAAPYRLGYAMPVYTVKPPRPDGLNSEFCGVAYAKLESGKIIAEFADGQHAFKNWDKFVEAIPEDWK